jgi:hypothetical protein
VDAAGNTVKGASFFMAYLPFVSVELDFGKRLYLACSAPCYISFRAPSRSAHPVRAGDRDFQVEAAQCAVSAKNVPSSGGVARRTVAASPLYAAIFIICQTPVESDDDEVRTS